LLPHFAIIGLPQAGQLPLSLGAGTILNPSTIEYCI
jgi:hypothetical protein